MGNSAVAIDYDELQDSDSHSTMQDNELLNAIAKKDQSAFDKLYKRYYKRVVNFAYQFVKQKDTALEVANDVMLAVWNQAEGFEHRSSVSTWIYGITYRQAQKAFTKNQRHDHDNYDEHWQQHNADEHDDETLSNGAAIDETALKTSDLEHAMQSQQLWGQMVKAIDTLNEDQKSVVYLTSIGYSYPEIAEMMDCPPNTVKTRMFHARRLIKELFQGLN